MAKSQGNARGKFAMSNNTTHYMTKGGKNTQGMMSAYQTAMYEEEEDQELANSRKMKPFSFDIDDDIDTEVLTNEQVYDDLQEIDDIIEEG